MDYGTVRVCDSKQLPLVLKNNGKYQVRYQFTLRSAVARELFSVQPDTGTVDPGKDVTVQVVFNAKTSLQRELSLTNAPDITLAIIEPLTSNKVRRTHETCHAHTHTLASAYTVFLVQKGRVNDCD